MTCEEYLNLEDKRNKLNEKKEKIEDMMEELTEQLEDIQEQLDEISNLIAREDEQNLEHAYWQSQF